MSVSQLTDIVPDSFSPFSSVEALDVGTKNTSARVVATSDTILRAGYSLNIAPQWPWLSQELSESEKQAIIEGSSTLRLRKAFGSLPSVQGGEEIIQEFALNDPAERAYLTIAKLITEKNGYTYSAYVSLPIVLRNIATGGERTILAHIDVAGVTLSEWDTATFERTDTPLATNFTFNWHESKFQIINQKLSAMATPEAIASLRAKDSSGADTVSLVANQNISDVREAAE